MDVVPISEMNKEDGDGPVSGTSYLAISRFDEALKNRHTLSLVWL